MRDKRKYLSIFLKYSFLSVFPLIFSLFVFKCVQDRPLSNKDVFYLFGVGWFFVFTYYRASIYFKDKILKVLNQSRPISCIKFNSKDREVYDEKCKSNQSSVSWLFVGFIVTFVFNVVASLVASYVFAKFFS